MKFDLAELHKKTQNEINKSFYSIPISENQVELTVSPDPEEYNQNLVAKGLIYLPGFVNSCVINIRYFYKYHPADADNPNSYESYTAQLQISEYIKSLPRSVTKVSLNFLPALATDKELRYSPENPLTVIASTIFEDLERTFGAFKNSVETVHIKGYPYSYLTPKDFSKALARLSTNRELIVEQANLCVSDADFKLKLHDKLLSLSLEASLKELEDIKLLELPQTLPLSLRSLGLGFSNLDRVPADCLLAFWSNLSKQLHNLVLAGNNLAAFGTRLTTLLPVLQYNYLDLSDNNILFLSTDLCTAILKSLSPTVKSLKFFETDTTSLTTEEIIDRYKTVPKHIETLSFAKCKFLGLGIAEFANIIKNLPEWIKFLDFSNLDLSKCKKEDLILLFSSVNPNIKKVILKANHLCSMDPETLKEVLAAFPKGTIIDISENGIEGLPNKQANRLLDALPNHPDYLFKLGKNFFLKPNGTLGLYSNGLKANGIFRAPKYLRPQQDFAALHVAFLQLIRQTKLNFDMIARLIPFLVPASVNQTNRMSQQLRFIESTTLGSKATRKDCEKVIKLRSPNNIPNDRRLNVSHCALHTLGAEGLQKFFNDIKPGYHSLIMRANGLFNTKQRRLNFISALPNLLPNIKFLDLSLNGFEKLPSKEQFELITKLPERILVTFGNEKPQTPAQHLNSRKIPNSFEKLTKDISNPLIKARFLLKYIRKDANSVTAQFKNFFVQQLDSLNIELVTKLETLIKVGKITDIDDLLTEINVQLDGAGETQLEKGSMFLSNSMALR